MSRAFVDTPIGDRQAADRAATVAAAEWGLVEPKLERLGMNAIYRAGEVVLRVSRPTAPAAAAIELHEVLGDHAIPVARAARVETVTVDSLSVTCWERVAAVAAPVAWRAVGAAIRRVHELDPATLPTAYPLVEPHDLPWWELDRLVADCSDLLDAPARAGIQGALDRWPGWQDWDRSSSSVICHGDVHPGNVVMTAGGPVLLDWDLMSMAPAGWDHAPLLTWAERWGGAPGTYEEFAAGYGRDLRIDPVALGYAELRLVAATLMRVRAAATDPAARPEAELRLAFWRGDPDAPQWTAQ